MVMLEDLSFMRVEAPFGWVQPNSLGSELLHYLGGRDSADSPRVTLLAYHSITGVLLWVVACHPQESDHASPFYVLKDQVAHPCARGIHGVPLMP